MGRPGRVWLGGALAVVLTIVGAGWWYVGQGLRRASRLAEFELWADARAELDGYLRLHARDDRAHMLYAETLVKDSQLDLAESTSAALAHLAQIPDQAPLGAIARLQEGRIEFLLLNHPVRGEERLRAALRIDPHATDAYRVLWKLYDQTGRSHLAEPLFRTVYQSVEWPERAILLREWYMSQFYPATANPLLDRLMGVAADRGDAAKTEVMRFIRFRNEEPDAPLGHAALARWFQLEGDPQFALQTLEAGLEKCEAAATDPYFLHTQVGILIELGEFDQAAAAFENWPEPHEGYEYWLSHAIILHEVRSEYAAALREYERALSSWPGQVDWRTRSRLAACLARMGDQERAKAERERIKAIERLLDDDVHESLRAALVHLNDRQRVREVEDFYRKIRCDFEADGWRDHLAQLAAGKSIPTRPPPATTAP